MTDQEIQELIDNKDWTALYKNFDVVMQPTAFSSELNNYQLNEDFFIEFFLNHVYMEKYSQYKSYPDAVVKVLDIIIDNFSTKRVWEAWYDYMTDVYVLTDSKGVVITGFFRKIADIIQLKTFIKKINGILSSMDDLLPNIRIYIDFEVKLLYGLSDSELMNFFEFYDKRFKFEFDEPEKLYHLFDDFQQYMNYLKKIQRNIYNIDFISEVPKEEIEKHLLEANDNLNLLVWYYNNPEQGISNEVLDEYLQNEMPNYVVIWMLNAMNKEQIIKYIDKLDFEVLLSKMDLEIDEIMKYKQPTDGRDYSNDRFFKEEELQKYPKLVNPKTLKHNALFFLSKDTFKMLNRAWGFNQKYNENLGKLYAIMYSMADHFISLDVFEYLIEKTGADNAEIIKVIMEQTNTPNRKKIGINTIKEFMRKYQ